MASPGEDIPVQLATLLGKPTVRIRRTGEVPPRVSIIDVVAAITSHSQSNSALTFARLKEEYPDVVVNCSEARSQMRADAEAKRTLQLRMPRESPRLSCYSLASKRPACAVRLQNYSFVTWEAI